SLNVNDLFSPRLLGDLLPVAANSSCRVEYSIAVQFNPAKKSAYTSSGVKPLHAIACASNSSNSPLDNAKHRVVSHNVALCRFLLKVSCFTQWANSQCRENVTIGTNFHSPHVLSKFSEQCHLCLLRLHAVRFRFRN